MPFHYQHSSSQTTFRTSNMRDWDVIPAAAPSGPTAGSRFLNCNICGREFGTASFPIHQKQCAQKHRVAQDQLRPPEVKKFKARKVPAEIMAGHPITSPLVVESKERAQSVLGKLASGASGQTNLKPSNATTQKHARAISPSNDANGVLTGELSISEYNRLALDDFGKSAVERGVFHECTNCGRKFGMHWC
jgi:hypothetical protein